MRIMRFVLYRREYFIRGHFTLSLRFFIRGHFTLNLRRFNLGLSDQGGVRGDFLANTNLILRESFFHFNFFQEVLRVAGLQSDFLRFQFLFSAQADDIYILQRRLSSIFEICSITFYQSYLF